MRYVTENNTIYEACKITNSDIRSDTGGGSSLEKVFLLSYLVQNQNLKSFIEIGVYKGKSFFPIAHSIYKNNGKSYGVDPYKLSYAKEKDLNSDLLQIVNDFLSNLDFNKLYKDVLIYKNSSDFKNSIKILRKSSETAISFFKKKKITTDLIHIDGNHDTKNVKKDFDLYSKIINKDGYIVFDDIDWKSVKPVYEIAKKKYIEVFSCKTFGILVNKDNSNSTKIFVEKLKLKLESIYNYILEKSIDGHKRTPTISVGILTYNHQNYIKRCINSVLSQQGKFNLKIFIINDCSNDNTHKIIIKLLGKLKPSSKIDIKYINNDKNIGTVSNLNKLIELFKKSKCDYFSFCEGDDYYLSTARLRKHLNLQIKNPNIFLSFNNLIIKNQESNYYEYFKPQNIKAPYTTEKLVTNNYIGNFSCCFYNSYLLKYINDDIFSFYTVDWFFNIFCSQYGDIGNIKEPLSVYRIHKKGTWSSLSQTRKILNLIKYIDIYNRYLKYTYDKYFSLNKNECLSVLSEIQNEKANKKIDLAVIDDVFPHEQSNFRYEEYLQIFKNIKNSYVFNTSQSLEFFNESDSEGIIINFKRKYPKYDNRLMRIEDLKFYIPKLYYCVFLNNAFYSTVEIAEKNKRPFIFTLYPGGGFGINNKDSDKKLKRVINSPSFLKVIVTQKNTYNYLIKKNFCPKEKIIFIYGVVTPLDKLNNEITDKIYYGEGKKYLDICFVAHRYTKFGEDKGYNVFLDTARLLSSRNINVRFHVVGNYNKSTLPANGIKNIKFYGPQNPEFFNEFYKKIDIILSPNVPNKIYEGSFDGFPTASCTDAALNNVAMFCSDFLHLNIKFKDKFDLVIINNDSKKIASTIEYYYNNPKEIIKISKNGSQKVKEIYSYKKQIVPRIKILKSCINSPFIYKEKITIMYIIKAIARKIIPKRFRIICFKLIYYFKYYIKKI